MKIINLLSIVVIFQLSCTLKEDVDERINLCQSAVQVVCEMACRCREDCEMAQSFGGEPVRHETFRNYQDCLERYGTIEENEQLNCEYCIEIVQRGECLYTLPIQCPALAGNGP